MINGSPCDFFGSFRGFRQGDPLSPLLFVIVMDTMGMLDKAVNEDRISGFKIGNVEGHSLVMSHLLFANDSLIFCDANLNRLLLLSMILIWFETISALK